MKEPLPRIGSARPLDNASTVANLWYTRTGSSVLSTVTAVLSLTFSVRVANPANKVSGAEIAKSAL